MKKRASTFLSSPGMAGKTLYDLFLEIQRDVSISQMERAQLMEQIKGVTGNAPASTPLTVLMARGLGGVVGNLLARYFGMGTGAQLVSTALGFGLGRKIYDQFNKPKEPFPGWKLL